MRIVSLLLILPAVLLADVDPRLGGPVSYSTPSPNGEYLFVMIAPRPKDGAPDPEKRDHEKAVYEKYKRSGLYRNDGSTTPLWTVDWYSYRAYPANDGKHLVRFHGEFPLTERYPASKRLPEETVAEQVNEPGLSFYANGKLLKIYAVRELVKKPETLPHSLQHVLWSADGVFTKENNEFCLMTQDARQVFFNIETGEINRDRAAGLGNAQLWAVRIGLVVVAVVGSIILVAWLYRLRNGTAATPGTPS